MPLALATLSILNNFINSACFLGWGFGKLPFFKEYPLPPFFFPEPRASRKVSLPLIKVLSNTPLRHPHGVPPNPVV